MMKAVMTKMVIETVHAVSTRTLVLDFIWGIQYDGVDLFENSR